MFRFFNIQEHPIFVYWLQRLLISRFLFVEFLFQVISFISQLSRIPSFCLTWGVPFDFYIRVLWVDNLLGDPHCIFRSFFLGWLYSPRIFSSFFRVEFWLQTSGGWVGGWVRGGEREDPLLSFVQWWSPPVCSPAGQEAFSPEPLCFFWEWPSGMGQHSDAWGWGSGCSLSGLAAPLWTGPVLPAPVLPVLSLPGQPCGSGIGS